MQPQGKTAKVLTVSSRSFRERGGNSATPTLFRVPEVNASQRARPHVFWIPTGEPLNKVYLEEWLYAGGDSSEEQNVIDVPGFIRQGARQLKRERSEGDHGFMTDVAAVHHHER